MGALKFILSRLCFIAGAAETNDSKTSYAMIRMLGAHFQNASSSSPNFMHHSNDGGGGGSTNNTNGGMHNSSMIGGPQCPHCGKTYSNSSNLRQHVRNVHVSVDKSLWHTCPTCAKKLKTKHYLINHQLQAHGIHQRGAAGSMSHPNDCI